MNRKGITVVGLLAGVFAVIAIYHGSNRSEMSESSFARSSLPAPHEAAGTTQIAGIEPVIERPEGHSTPPVPPSQAVGGAHPAFEGLPPFAETELGDLFHRIRGGDTEAAREAGERLATCRNLLHNRLLIPLLEYGSLDDAQTRALSQLEKNWASGAYGDDEDRWRNDVTRTVERYTKLERDVLLCLPYWRSSIAALRKEVETLAEAGNPAARALFALWSPRGDFLWWDRQEIARWEARAMEFSMANLVAGEPIALFVFATAYRDPRYFLPYNGRVASMFDMAIVRCGLDLSGNQLRSIEVWRYPGGRQPVALNSTLLHPLVSWSEELRPFCRTGIWLSREEVTSLVSSEPAS